MIVSLLVVISVDSAATYLRQEALLSREGTFFGLTLACSLQVHIRLDKLKQEQKDRSRARSAAESAVAWAAAYSAALRARLGR
jgi:hypothetical protein